MQFGFSTEFILGMISLILAVTLAVIGFRLPSVRGARQLAIINTVLAVCALALLLGLSVDQANLKRLFGSFQFISGAVGGMIFLFAYRFNRFDAKLNRPISVIVILEPVITLILALTDTQHDLMRVNPYLVGQSTLRLVPSHFGPWFWLDLIYGGLMYLGGATLMAVRLLRAPLVYRRSVVLFLLGLSFPLVDLLYTLSGYIQVHQVEYHLLSMTLAILLLSWAGYSRRLGSILPFSRDIIFHHMDQGLLLVDLDARILDANPFALALLAKPANEVINHNINEFLPDVSVSFLQLNEQDGSDPLTQEVDINDLTFLIFFSPIYDVGSAHVGWVAMIRDITRRKETERELNRVQGRYRAFIEQSQDGFVLLDEQSNVVEWNMAMEVLTQIPREQVLGQPFPTVMFKMVPIEKATEDVGHQLRSMLAEASVTGVLNFGNNLVEKEIVRQDGTRRITQLMISPIQSDLGYQVGVSVRDITPARQAEWNLQDSEKRFRMMADATPVMIWIADREGSFSYLNHAWVDFTGRPVDELLALGWNRLCHPDDLPGLLETIQQADQENRGFTSVFRMKNKTGEYRWLLNSAARREGPAGELVGFSGSCVDISDQKEREIELRSLTRAIEQSPVSVVITDLRGNIEYVNPRFCELTGYRLEEAIGKNPSILKSGDTSPEDYQRLWATIRRGEEWHGVFHNRKKNGELFWEKATISPITDAQGKITHFLGIKEDITAQILVEAELATQRAQVEAVFNNPLIGIALTDRDGNYANVNPRLAEMLGYSVDELISMNVADVTHPDAIEETRELRNALADGIIDRFRQEKRYVRKNGSLFWSEIAAMRMTGDHGETQEIISFVTDISERKAIEEKLLESEALYRSVISASPDDITITDLRGEIRYASPVAFRMFGYQDVDELTGKMIVDFLVPGDRERAKGQLAKMVDTRLSSVGEYRGIRQDGSTFFLEVNGDVFLGVDGKPEGLVLVARDVSLRKALETEQHQRMQELEALNETMHDVSSQLDLPRVLEAIMRRVTALLGAGECEVALYDELKNVMRIVVCFNRDRDYTGVEMQMGEGIMGRAAQTQKTILIEDYATWEGRSPQYEPVHRAVICVPLIHNQRLLGAVSVSADPAERKFTVRDIRLIEMFSQQAAIAVQNAKLFMEVQRLAITDPLTGINNRRAFFDRARQEFSRSTRYQHRMSVIMLDVDHFKKINDRFGHAAGDEALRLIAGQCVAVSRSSDVIGRYGGEEFIILLPETPLNGALSMAQRLCDQIASTRMPSERGEIRMTVSVGVAEINQEVNDLETLIEKADQALYRAKQSGRNRVAI